MKKVLVFSDTHGNYRSAIKLIESITDLDACIHCGDMLRDCREIENAFPELPFYYVCGNNEFTTDVPYDKEVTIGGNKIFITHGHRYRVKSGISLLKEKFADGYNIILYGHTHIPDQAWQSAEQLIINPGSFGFFNSTCLLLELESKGNFKFTYLKDE